MVLAAQFAITLRGGAGVRVVCEFLELSGLSAFVGASYGSQQALNAALEGALVAVAEEQRTALAEGMAHRDVTVCEDETFHPRICLVALEPVSNFILLEQYADDRSAATWTQALEAALAGLNVEVIQGTSDEVQALRHHIEGDCQAHHSPAPFHGQRDLSTQLLEPLRQNDHPLQALAPVVRANIKQVAGECADLFQRSSSAVEGRNSQLSLYHHGRHCRSDNKLAALTAVHNFHIRRADGTTAAERFCARDHAPLFEQLIDRVPLPPRPRRRRPRPPKQPYLMSVAA